jgi:hypothetical protein
LPFNVSQLRQEQTFCDLQLDVYVRDCRRVQFRRKAIIKDKDLLEGWWRRGKAAHRARHPCREESNDDRGGACSNDGSRHGPALQMVFYPPGSSHRRLAFVMRSVPTPIPSMTVNVTKP